MQIYPTTYDWKDDEMYLIQHEDGTFHCPECDTPAFKENGCFYYYIGKRRSKCCRAFFSEHAMSKRKYRKLIRNL